LTHDQSIDGERSGANSGLHSIGLDQKLDCTPAPSCWIICRRVAFSCPMPGRGYASNEHRSGLKLRLMGACMPSQAKTNL
jgi:hypothetical protein